MNSSALKACLRLPTPSSSSSSSFLLSSRRFPSPSTPSRIPHTLSSPFRRYATPSPSSPTPSPVAGPSTETYRPMSEQEQREYVAALHRATTARQQGSIRTGGMYLAAGVIFMVGASYAAVPIYRAFCGATGFAGIPNSDKSRMSPERLMPTDSERRIKVHFNAAKSDILPWTFKPAQPNVTIRPGETALAFYTAKNNSDKDVIGISTYNVTPGKIAPYFAKVECFCFEEQQILANEEVDLPVFFFIDRDVLDDPRMDDVSDVVLNYTFFKARRNDRGHSVPDASQKTIEEASGFADFELANPEVEGSYIPEGANLPEGDWVQVGAK
ncbi:cytochrome c oxidase assembly protein CtaG/Cox11-domain-containing protein [Mrakia frigida]|uniref:Cox11p n=1 Tax=Mrakia frigida TaxID=29902 RepID=UPI003FCC25EC